MWIKLSCTFGANGVLQIETSQKERPENDLKNFRIITDDDEEEIWISKYDKENSHLYMSRLDFWILLESETRTLCNYRGRSVQDTNRQVYNYDNLVKLIK